MILCVWQSISRVGSTASVARIDSDGMFWCRLCVDFLFYSLLSMFGCAQFWFFLVSISKMTKSVQTHTHTCITALLPVLSGWAGTRKVKPIWILLKQETVSGSGISWVVCKSAPRCRQITTPATDHSVFYRPDALPAQPTASKHWTDKSVQKHGMIKLLNVKDMLKISAWKQNRKKWWKEQKKWWKRTEKSWWNL